MALKADDRLAARTTRLLLEAEHETFQQLVLQNLRPLFDAQLSLAKGVTFVYRVTEGPRGGQSDPVLLTDPEELHQAIQAIEAGKGKGVIVSEDEDDEGEPVFRHTYYSLTTKAPETRAIDSLIDRAFGKSVQRIAGGDGGPIQIQGVEISVGRK